MAKLTKSLTELDAAADELLAKSKAAEDDSSDEELKPEEVSDDSTAPESEDAEAEPEKEEIEKSEDTEEISEDDSEEDEEIEKSEDASTDEEDNEELEKSEDIEDDESEETEDESVEDETKSAEEIEKSIRDDFESEDAIRKGMDNSEFFSSIVDVFAKSMGDMQYDVQSQGRAQSAASDILAKSLQAVMSSNQTLQAENERLTRRINKLEKSITMGFEKVMDSLDEIASQPAHLRKSMASVSIQDRDFERSIHGQQVSGGFESLSKSQVLTVLNNELYAGNQNVAPADIISYESGAPLRQDLQQLVVNKCR